MKTKLLTLLAILSIALFSSCSKDEEEVTISSKNEEEEVAISLVGTTWYELDGTVEKSISFISATSSEYTIASTVLTLSYTLSYYYEYDDPTIYFESLDSGAADLKGVIVGNTMTITNLSSGEDIAYLTKQ